MNKENLIKYIKSEQSPEQVNIIDLQELEQEFPYFQAVKLLILNYKLKKDPVSLDEHFNEISPYISYIAIINRYFSLESEMLQHNTTDISAIVEKEKLIENIPDKSVKGKTPDKQIAEKAIDNVPAKSTRKEFSSSIRENISNLLSDQLNDLENEAAKNEEIVPEISIDISKEYENNTNQENPTAEDKTGLLQIDEESGNKKIIDSVNEPDRKRELNIPDLLEIDNDDEENKLELNKIHSESSTTFTNKTDNSPLINKNESGLIEKFIENKPRISPVSPSTPLVDISEDSIKEHEGFFTETLAGIYIKQGYYHKAIFAFEKLILKYPEKSDYFAEKINDLKKLIKNS